MMGAEIPEIVGMRLGKALEVSTGCLVFMLSSMRSH